MRKIRFHLFCLLALSLAIYTNVLVYGQFSTIEQKACLLAGIQGTDTKIAFAKIKESPINYLRFGFLTYLTFPIEISYVKDDGQYEAPEDIYKNNLPRAFMAKIESTINENPIKIDKRSTRVEEETIQPADTSSNSIDVDLNKKVESLEDRKLLTNYI